MGALLVLLEKIWVRLLTLCWRFFIAPKLRAQGVVIAAGVKFYGWPLVQMAAGSSIELGAGSVVCSDSRFTALGVAKPVILKTLQTGAEIYIGADTGMSGTVVCAARSVRIGHSCLIGADVVISDTDFHAVDPRGRRHRQGWVGIGIEEVVIGDNVFIGAGARILKGVNIGANSIIGAGSVVTGNIPANVIAAGVPCRAIGTL